MKKISLFVVVLLILGILLVSCAPTEKAAPADEKEVKEIPKEKVELPGTAMEAEDEEPEEEPETNYDEGLDEVEGLSAELITLMSKGKDKAKNVYYLYRGAPLFREANEYYILGNKLKIVNPPPQQYERETYYNVVYVDLNTKETTGYCEDRKRCPSLNTPLIAGAYEDEVGVLPAEWYDKMDSAVLIGTEEIFGRDAEIYEFDYNGMKSKIWIDPFYGLPLQVRVDEYSDEPTIYHYEIKKVGGVKAVDVEHQTLDE